VPSGIYRQSEKNLLNSNISFTCLHSMMNFHSLMTEICWRVWGTLANFNEFYVLASLLHRRRSTEVNQTLHDVWLSPGLVHYIYTFLGFLPLMEFRQVQNSLCIQVLHSPILAALLHGTRAVWGRPSCWALARILVSFVAIKSLLTPLLFDRLRFNNSNIV